MRLTKLAIAASALILTANAQSVATFWNDYPACERQCHQTVYGNQSCTLQNKCSCSGCLCLADSCLCETASWLTAVTQCIGQECGASAVSEAAGIANNACNNNGYPLVVSEQTLIAEGLAAVVSSPSPAAASSSTTKASLASTSTSTSTTSTSTSTPTSKSSSSSISTSSSTSQTLSPADPNNSTSPATNPQAATSHHGLSTALIAVISVLSALVAVLIIGGLFYWRHRKRKALANSRNPRPDGGASHPGYDAEQKIVSDQTTRVHVNAIPGGNNAVGQRASELETGQNPAQTMSSFSGSTVTPTTWYELEGRR